MTTPTNPPDSYDPWVAAFNPSTNYTKYIAPNYGKAISAATAIIDRGHFHSLAHETREFLINTKNVKLARFLESLYFGDFKSGPITAKQAAELLLPIAPEKPVRIATTGKNRYTSKKPSLSAMYQHCLKMLEMLALLQDFFKPMIQDVNLFPEMPFERKEKVSHRPEKVYYIPAAFVLNDLINPKPTYIALPARALDDDKTYKAFVWKKPIVEKGKVIGKQIDLCKDMNITPRTMKRYTLIAGVRTEPIYISRRLSSREVARLPKNRQEQHKSKQYFNSVHDQHGFSARANLDDITRKGLDGYLFCNKRTGSKFTDETFDAWIVQLTYVQAQMSDPPTEKNDLIIKNADLVFTIGKTDNKSPRQRKRQKKHGK